MLPSIDVNEHLYLSPPQAADINDYVQLLNDPVIYENTLMIPSPYYAENAEWFFNYARDNAERHGRWLDWSVRRRYDHKVIGGVSFHGKAWDKRPAEEIGYWIGSPYRGQGIATAVVKRFVQYGFYDCGYVRIEAPIYWFNQASQRVVQKCGFTEEGYLRKAYLKNGVYLDAKLFAIVQ